MHKTTEIHNDNIMNNKNNRFNFNPENNLTKDIFDSGCCISKFKENKECNIVDTIDYSKLTKQQILDDVDRQLELNFTICSTKQDKSIFNSINQRKEYFKKEYEAIAKINEALDIIMQYDNEYRYNNLRFNVIGKTKKGNEKVLTLDISETLEEINRKLLNITHGEMK